MKKLIWALVLVVAILVVACAFWLNHKGAGKIAISNPQSVIGVKPPTPPPSFSGAIKPGDWQEFRNDRDSTLNSNPELASEFKDIMKEMDSQQKDLEAAMIKANPKVAPIVAKLEFMRKNPAKPAASTAPGKPRPGILTQDEMAQLRAARFAAVKANPDFDTKAKQLAAKLTAFQQKLTAAMVQSDPKVAAVLDKMGTQHPQTPSPPAKPE